MSEKVLIHGKTSKKMLVMGVQKKQYRNKEEEATNSTREHTG